MSTDILSDNHTGRHRADYVRTYEGTAGGAILIFKGEKTPGCQKILPKMILT